MTSGITLPLTIISDTELLVSNLPQFPNPVDNRKFYKNGFLFDDSELNIKQYGSIELIVTI